MNATGLPVRRAVGRKPSRRSHPILRAIGAQFVFAVVTLLLLTMITFAATTRSPMTQARDALGREVTTAQLEAFVQQHNLDRPIYVRYGEWLTNAVSGDLGTSIITDKPVGQDIATRFGRTLILAIVALLICIPVATSLGVFMARRAGRWSDTSLLSITTVVTALPEFIIGILLILIFGVWLGWLPVDSSALSFGTTAEKVKTYILPIATLVIATVPYTLRIARAAARESLGAQYTRAAVLRGLPRRTVIWDHAMRNAAIPIISTLAMNLLYMVGGVVVVETVFGFPGIGQRLVEAVSQGDTITVQAIALIMGAMFITLMFLADLLALYFDPRLRASTS